MVRRDFRRCLDAFGPGASEGLHRLPGGQVEQVERLPLVGRQCKVALDHQALGHGRVAGESELRRDLALVHLTVA